MRRRQGDPDLQPAVPEEIAAGPEVRRWADPESLLALALLPDRPTTKAVLEARGDAIFSCMLSARRNWCTARDEWAIEAGYTRLEGMKHVSSRRPYWKDCDFHRLGPEPGTASANST